MAVFSGTGTDAATNSAAATSPLAANGSGNGASDPASDKEKRYIYLKDEAPSNAKVPAAGEKAKGRFGGMCSKKGKKQDRQAQLDNLKKELVMVRVEGSPPHKVSGYGWAG